MAGGTAVHALTDVTGFGLIGHAREMAEGLRRGLGLSMHASAIPLLPGALECVTCRLHSRRSEGES